jgi:NodT family efflux transporter outer membrane factor (OMF) lipoprotein
MTAFTFILGVLPMVFATGAGSASRQSIGTTVLFGMLAATLFGIILVPALYVLFQTLREKIHTKRIRLSQSHLLTIFLLLPLFSMFMGGCATVGPNYTRPEMPEIPEAVEQTIDVAEWWKQFNDPALIQVVERALENNRDMNTAIAKVRQARAILGRTRAAYGPAFAFSGGLTHSKSSENADGDGSESTVYSTGFDATWEIDVFGGTRRSVEAAKADWDAMLIDLSNVQVSVASETALAYIALRTHQYQLTVAHANLALQQNTYDIVEERWKSGLSSELSMQQARYNIEDTRSGIPTIEARIESARNALSILIGELPGRLEIADISHIPQSTLVLNGIPADLLRRRPDVQRAERELAAQTARIGVATADLYPRFTLSGSIGLESLDESRLLTSSSGRYNIIPGIKWPIFNFGSIRNNIKVQEAIREQYLHAYESTILTAVGEIRTTLMDYNKEQVRRSSLQLAVDAARTAEELAQDQYRNGLSDFSNVLDAQRSLLTFQEQLALSEGAVSQNAVRLYKAMGGGWKAME